MLYDLPSRDYIVDYQCSLRHFFERLAEYISFLKRKTPLFKVIHSLSYLLVIETLGRKLCFCLSNHSPTYNLSELHHLPFENIPLMLIEQKLKCWVLYVCKTDHVFLLVLCHGCMIKNGYSVNVLISSILCHVWLSWFSSRRQNQCWPVQRMCLCWNFTNLRNGPQCPINSNILCLLFVLQWNRNGLRSSPNFSWACCLSRAT